MTKYRVKIKKSNGDIINTVEVTGSNVHDILYYVYGIEMPDNSMWKTGIIIEVFREIKTAIYQCILVVED